jgi:metal transporter CNNM
MKIICLAINSGLTLGLMSLDVIGLEILKSSPDGNEADMASELLPIRKKGNQLLCSLVLMNTSVNSVLSIFLGESFGGIVGTISATILLVLFGEILPQAICSRLGLKVGYYLRHLVKLFMFVTFILAYPLSHLLDWILGAEIGAVYTREQMRRLVEVHSEEKKMGGELIKDEIVLLTGALKFTNYTADQVMTRIDKVFMLDVNARLDHATLGRIVESVLFSQLCCYAN